MKVAICGPNLCTRGETMHVHAAGCADLKHYGPGRKHGGDDRGWVVDVTSALDVSKAVYADMVYGDQGLKGEEADEVFLDYLTDFRFFPCARGLD